MHQQSVRSSCKQFSNFPHPSGHYCLSATGISWDGCQPPSTLSFTAPSFLSPDIPHPGHLSLCFHLRRIHRPKESVTIHRRGVVTSLPAGIEGFRLKGRSERRISMLQSRVGRPIRRRPGSLTPLLFEIIHSLRSCSRGPGQWPLLTLPCLLRTSGGIWDLPRAAPTHIFDPSTKLLSFS